MGTEKNLLDLFKQMSENRMGSPFGMSQSYSSVSYKGPFDNRARSYSSMGIDTPFGSIRGFKRGR